MSLDSYMWATRQRTGSYGANFLLRVLADRVDMRGYCKPKINSLCDSTEMTKQELLDALNYLAIYGYITINWDLDKIRLHIPMESAPE